MDAIDLIVIIGIVTLIACLAYAVREPTKPKNPALDRDRIYEEGA